MDVPFWLHACPRFSPLIDFFFEPLLKFVTLMAQEQARNSSTSQEDLMKNAAKNIGGTRYIP
jgi:hypothetical protein